MFLGCDSHASRHDTDAPTNRKTLTGLVAEKPTSYVIETTKDGTISGAHVVNDPVTGEEIFAGTVSGRRSGDHARWIAIGGAVVEGDYVGSTFVGTVTHPDIIVDEQPLQYNLKLEIEK
jgi:hypothetical protein